MVVFTCQHCGASLQKNKVEKHYATQCRRTPYVTCIDCLKDFRGDEYVAHTECVTEQQRYGGKDFVPKESSNVKKRTTWISAVKYALWSPNLTENDKSFISACLKYQNIPQKRQKFHNFVKSSFGRNAPNGKVVDSVFDLFETTYKKNIEQEKSESSSNNVANGKNEKENTNKEINEGSNIKTKNSVEKKQKQNGGSLEVTESEQNGDMHKEKKKKKKKDIDETEAQTEVDDEANKRLSKKERKERKKREKYEAELNEIQNCKTKNKVTNEEDTNNHLASDSKNDEITNGNTHKKKRLHEETVTDEPVKKKSKATNNTIEHNGNESESVTTFKWENVIIQLLESRSDKEMSLPRLAKKIINEYYAVHGENHMSYEKLMAKFNKKVHKTAGVKVLKDKAKLVICE